MGNYGPNDVAQMAYFSFGKKAHKQLTQMITIIIIIISLNGLCFIRFSILSPPPPPSTRQSPLGWPNTFRLSLSAAGRNDVCFQLSLFRRSFFIIICRTNGIAPMGRPPL